MTPPRTHPRWTKEQDELLMINYGAMRAPKLAGHINGLTGSNRSPEAVRMRASQLGLSATDNQGLLTVKEASRQLGMSTKAVWNAIKRRKLPVVRGAGRYWFLADKTWAALQAHFAKPPVPCLSTAEAAKRLNFSRPAITAACKQGRIPAFVSGTRHLIPVAEVERLERLQRRAATLSDREPRRSA